MSAGPPLDPNNLAGFVRDLAEALALEPDALIRNYDLEIPPEKIELIYRAPPAGSGDEASPADSEAPGVASLDTLPANFRCNLCPDRMVPVRRFFRGGSRSLLVLHHSGRLEASGQPPRDRSMQFVFGSAAEDGLFERMLEAAGLQMADVHFQEYPACLFNADRSLPEEWNARGKHCLSHVHDTIIREKIRLVLATGAAAILLLGEDRARELSTTGEAIELPLGPGQAALPLLVLRSPAALLALESRRVRMEQAGQDSREARSAEKEVKAATLRSLKGALQKLNERHV